MAALHPVCGKPLKQLTKSIAIVDMAHCIVYIATSVGISLIRMIKTSSEFGNRNLNEQLLSFETAADFLTVSFGALPLMVFQLVLAIELFQGVKKDNYWRCRVWVIVNACYVVFLALALISSVIVQRESHTTLWLLFCGLFFFIKSYMVWIAYTYVGELKNDLALKLLSSPVPEQL